MSSSVSPLAAEFKGISKEYRCGFWPKRTIQALRGVTLSIPAGSLFGLVGPNRAGKTTLVKLLLSIAHPTRGEVFRLGRPVSDRTTLAQVGYVHDSQAFPSYLTARSLLKYYGTLSGMSAAELREAIELRLLEVGLSDRAAESIAGFSKGMLQRLALAQATLNDPELLVLDEPAEGMDLSARQMLHDLLLRRHERGKTAILVSHSLADVERVCDHVAVLNSGEASFAGRLVDLLRQQDREAGCCLEEALQPLYAGAAP
jgi:ABC-2 type transport system ATP-binding protein